MSIQSTDPHELQAEFYKIKASFYQQKATESDMIKAANRYIASVRTRCNEKKLKFPRNLTLAALIRG
jgi:ribosomal protein L29